MKKLVTRHVKFKHQNRHFKCSHCQATFSALPGKLSKSVGLAHTPPPSFLFTLGAYDEYASVRRTVIAGLLADINQP